MSTNRYEIFESEDDTFAVEIFGGIGVDVTVPKFATRKDAEDFVANERRKLGIDGRWQAIND
jgi:hypothetical protein